MPTFRPSLLEWNQRRSINERRTEALQRLYARKNAVDDLIRSLEDYQRITPSRSADCIPLTVAEKCS